MDRTLSVTRLIIILLLYGIAVSYMPPLTEMELPVPGGWRLVYAVVFGVFAALVIYASFYHSLVQKTDRGMTEDAGMNLAGASGDAEIHQQVRELLEEKGRYQSLMDLSQDAILIQFEAKILYLNDRAKELLCTGEVGDVIGKNFFEQFVCEDNLSIRNDFTRVGKEKIVHIQDVSLARGNGQQFLAEIKAVQVPFQGKAAIQTVIYDVSERMESRINLRNLSQAIEQNPSSVMITDVRGSIEYVNKKFMEITGYSRDEVVGRNANILNAEQSNEIVLKEMQQTITSGHEWRGEILNKRKSGETFWEQVTVSPVVEENGDISHFLSLSEDISGQKEIQRKLDFHTSYDNLSGLPNRDLAMDRLRQALTLAKRHDRMLALMYIDLDRFKHINESMGHAEGDRLLKEASVRLKAFVGEGDTLARPGGDEFIIILPDIDSLTVPEILANNILEAFSIPFDINDEPIFVTPSIGVTLYPGDGDTAEVLMRNVDAAMFKAKDGGRNTCRFFTLEMDQLAHENLRLDSQLRNALANNEFSVHYQPVIDIISNRLIGAEALLRWNNPELGQVPPDRFLPIAEETGLIDSIGAWVLSRACKDARPWIEEIPDFRLAVNISPVQFKDGKLARPVTRALIDADIPPHCLELELTESLLVEDAPMTSFALRELKQMGVRLSIDDFGTGYSALSYLKRFPFDNLKIDQAFVRELSFDPQNAALVTAIIAMARGLGLQVIGEGVETPEQLEILKHENCDFIQGYYFSMPLTAEEFVVFKKESSKINHL